jgi:tRNA dimethylallyltransferase
MTFNDSHHPMTFDAVLVAGPTASGKSAAALALAEALGGAIINTDSMQVYAEAPILTAQPGTAEMARAPHLLYGHVGARESYSVGRYAVDAAAALTKARDQGKLPIFVGGTGLYFMALTQGLAHVPPIPAEIRAGARALLEKIGAPALHTRLGERDSRTAALLRPTDSQRVLRAFEVWEATERSLVDWQQAPAEPILKNLKLAKFVTDLPRADLHARIAARFEAMVEEGALAEALALKDLDPALPAAKLLGLRPLIGLAEGRLTKAEALTQAIIATRQFAKRQLTWFRHRMGDYVWFNPIESNIISLLKQKFT